MSKKAVEGSMNSDWISFIMKDRSTKAAIYAAGDSVKRIAEARAAAKAKRYKPSKAMAREMEKARTKGRGKSAPKQYHYGTTGRKLGGMWGLTYLLWPMTWVARDPKNLKLLEQAAASSLARKKD